MKLRRTTVVLAAILAMVGSAQAAMRAQTLPGATNLRQWPGFDQPVVARISGSTRIEVHGCLEDVSWCDVSAGGKGGWMAAWRLAAYHRGRWVSIADHPDILNVTVVTRGMLRSRMATEAGPMPDKPPRMKNSGESYSGRVEPNLAGRSPPLPEPIPVPRPDTVSEPLETFE